jgi:N-acetylmuramoyl-L-alanine amidase
MKGLLSLGHEVIDCRPGKVNTVTQSLGQRCLTANRQKANIYVSIHFNCFNSKAFGTEVFAISETGKEVATSVLEKIVALGFANRGVKDGGKFYVLRNTDMPAILIECCFCDSQKDMDLFAKVGPDAIANAIVHGLTGIAPLDETNFDPPSIRID